MSPPSTEVMGQPVGDYARRIVVASGTTNGTGDVTFAFSPAFSSPPHVSPTITVQSVPAQRCRLTAVSASSCTVRVETQDQAFLSLLGLNILTSGVTPLPGATVSITAIER